MKQIVTIAWLLLAVSICSEAAGPLLYKVNNMTGSLDPEVKMDATELITSKGYPCENYYVTTKDGYILNIIRIPHSRKNLNITGPKQVVLLQHGLLGSATNFLTNLANESLAYILADSGADVWLGNSRGNIYSANHTKLDPKEREFWQFSWDEMAEFDLPATINFILAKTGVDQIYYVGHSQGTTIGFARFSEDQELASKIKHFIAMAPVARVGYVKSPIAKLAPEAKQIADFYNIFGHGAFEVEPEMRRWLAADLCNKWGNVICANFIFIICGFDYRSFNMSRVPVYTGHSPGGTSVTNVLHWAQGVNSKEFLKFDYGSADENVKHYGQPTPPIYEPRKVKVPVAVFRGGQDWLADDIDVDWLLSQLNLSLDVYISHYAHLDFIWAFDSPDYIYNDIVRIVLS